MFDLLITGGRILDGAGGPWYWADVAIQNDRIVEIGSLAGAAFRREIQAIARLEPTLIAAGSSFAGPSPTRAPRSIRVFGTGCGPDRRAMWARAVPPVGSANRCSPPTERFPG